MKKYSVVMPFGFMKLFTAGLAAFLAGCGGGSSTAPPDGGSTPTASVTTATGGKAPWNLTVTAQFSLKGSDGVAVPGALSCTSDTPTALSVAADCSTLTGKRLGMQSVSVSGAGLTAQVMVKVIPQAQALASHGPSSATGGGQFNLVVTSSGRVLAWGANPDGVLGQGKTSAELESLSLPTAVKGSGGTAELTGIVAASAGTGSALALTEDGEVYSWGQNGDHELGRVAANGDLLPAKVVSPTGSGTLQHIVAVSMGDSNAVALADDGTVFSWGNYSGQAGVSRAEFANTVSAVSGSGALGNAVAISAGWNWSAALLSDGRIVSWGFDPGEGWLGQGTVPTRASNVPPGYVVALDTGLPVTGAVSLSAGYNFGLALTDAAQVFGWGGNRSGQIGQTTTSAAFSSAVLVKAADGAGPLSAVVAAVAGGYHALALDNTGRVLSWGASQSGQLGDGANHPRVNQSALPAPVVSAAGTGELTGVTAIAAGFAHGLALTGNAGLLIWGTGFRGNLAQGGTASADSYVPLPVKNEAGTDALSLGPLTHWPNLVQRGR